MTNISTYTCILAAFLWDGCKRYSRNPRFLSLCCMPTLSSLSIWSVYTVIRTILFAERLSPGLKQNTGNVRTDPHITAQTNGSTTSLFPRLSHQLCLLPFFISGCCAWFQLYHTSTVQQYQIYHNVIVFLASHLGLFTSCFPYFGILQNRFYIALLQNFSRAAWVASYLVAETDVKQAATCCLKTLDT
jgi:hypothetical protein